MGKHSTASWLVAEGVIMKQRFTYDCVLIKEDDGYCASFPQVPGAFADGDTREEAIAHAGEALMAFLADDLNLSLIHISEPTRH